MTASDTADSSAGSAMVGSSATSAPSSVPSAAAAAAASASALTFHEFLERMKQPAASDLVRHIRSFITGYMSKAVEPDKDGESVQQFYRDTEAAFARHVLWRGASQEELESSGEALERYLMVKLHGRAFCPVKEEEERDRQLSLRIRALQTFLRPHHLDIAAHLENDASWLLAEKELQRMTTFKAPCDKVLCLLKCCRFVNNLLLSASISAAAASAPMLGESAGGHGGGSGGGNGGVRPPGADDFLPVLIYVVVKANPSQLLSNLLYIQRYRGGARLSGEAAYFYTNLVSAASFLESLTAEQLSIDPAEYHRLMEQGMMQAVAAAAAPEAEAATVAAAADATAGADAAGGAAGAVASGATGRAAASAAATGVSDVEQQGSQVGRESLSTSSLSSTSNGSHSSSSSSSGRGNGAATGGVAVSSGDGRGGGGEVRGGGGVGGGGGGAGAGGMREVAVTVEELQARREVVRDVVRADASGELARQYRFLYASADDVRVGDVPELLHGYKDLALRYIALCRAVHGVQLSISVPVADAAASASIPAPAPTAAVVTKSASASAGSEAEAAGGQGREDGDGGTRAGGVAGEAPRVGVAVGASGGGGRGGEGGDEAAVATHVALGPRTSSGEDGVERRRDGVQGVA